VPTIAENVPGYDAGVTFGLYALSATPKDVVKKINADVEQIIKDPEFHKRFLEPMVVQAVPGSPEGFAQYLGKDAAKWSKLIQAAGLKVDGENHRSARSPHSACCWPQAPCADTYPT